MKKFIVTCLLVTLTAANFSFTPVESDGISIESKFLQRKRYTITLSQTVPIQGSNCTITVAIMFTFIWGGPGTPVTQFEPMSDGQFWVNCPPGTGYSRSSSITNILFDSKDAHCISIEFAPTKDSFLDSKLIDPNFIKALKDAINSQTDAQKP